ncbi:MAG: NAD(P)H-dependent oxidoreductase subunit E [Bacteroidales bacterium]|jgi:NADH-quinone oxidoreductase subunit E|nr:NAD(P)H-dependent oxidoreductase subunit E [Bacteroidales bacterium]
MSDIKVNHHLFTKEGSPVAFSPETLGKIEVLIGHYPAGQQKSALLPILHIAQEELGGYLSVDVMDYVAEQLNIQPIEVYEVATFYSMFYLEKTGKYVIEVCRTGPCAISGGEKIIDHLKKTLEINTDETTPDGLFTLKEVECLGSCGTAPVMQINTEFYEQLTKEKIDQILKELKENANQDKPHGSKWVEKFF